MIKRLINRIKFWQLKKTYNLLKESNDILSPEFRKALLNLHDHHGKELDLWRRSILTKSATKVIKTSSKEIRIVNNVNEVFDMIESLATEREAKKKLDNQQNLL